MTLNHQFTKAAVTIQAAYRGHTVRQALTPESTRNKVDNQKNYL